LDRTSLTVPCQSAISSKNHATLLGPIVAGFGKIPSTTHRRIEAREAGTILSSCFSLIILRRGNASSVDIRISHQGGWSARSIGGDSKEYVDYCPWFYKHQNGRFR